MQVNSSGQMQQTQMRKMDGSEGGQGGGMKETMQALSPEDRTAVREQMASLSPTDRTTMKDQMSQLDTTSLTSEDLGKTLMSMLTALQEPATTATQTTLDTYA
ncbi:MAG: hypothetical protein WCW84_03270 [Sulfurimonas sp.]|jgi:hypothetical protein